MFTTLACGVLDRGIWFAAGAVTAAVAFAAAILIAVWFIDDRPPARKR